MKYRTARWGLVPVLGAALAIAGCGGSSDTGTSSPAESRAGSPAGSSPAGSAAESPAEGSAPAVDGTGKKLTVWIMEGTNADASAFFADVSKDFKAATGADVDVQMVPWADAHNKFTTSIAGGTGPDVAEVGTTWVGEFAEAGALTDITSQIDGIGGKDSLVDGLVQASTYDEKMYGMPWYAGVRSVIYRKDLFEKAGITKDPTTWAELRDAALKLKAADPSITAFPTPGDASHVFNSFIWGAGGQLATQEGDKITCALTDPKAQEGIQFYADLALKDGVSSPAATTWKETDVRDSFIQGKSAMIVSGSWTPKAIIGKNADLKDKLGVFPIPGKDGGMSPSFLGGSVLSVFEGSKEKELAFEFVKLMTTGKYAEKWATETGFFPGTKDLMAKAVASTDPTVAPFAKQFTEAGTTYPVSPAWGKVEAAKVLNAMMQSVLSGKADVATATKTACDEMTKALGS